MRFKILLLMTLGLLLALTGAFGTYHYTRALEAEVAAVRAKMRDYGDLVRLPVASRDRSAGESLTAADFTFAEVPSKYLPAHVLRALPDATEGAAFLSLAPLRAGALLLDSDLALAGSGEAPGLMPSANGRIFAVTVRNMADFDGALEEGSLIDLFWTRPIGGAKFETRLLATGLRLRLPGSAAPDVAAGGPAVGGAGAEAAGTGAAGVTAGATAASAGARMPAAAAEGEAMNGRLLLEGDISQASLSLAASQSGAYDILLSDGSRSTLDEIVVIAPTELEKLPLAKRDGGAMSALPADLSMIEKITGSGDRKTCSTFVIRGGTRSLSEVPC